MPGGWLPRANTELMILRTAHNCGSEYEWRTHESLAQTAGLTPEQINELCHDSPGSCLSVHQRLLLRSVDELHIDRMLSDETWSSLRVKLDDAQRIELCMLVGHYEMLAMTLNSLGVQPDIPSSERLQATARPL
jgi:alkylhydroperoxidase family enzyme